MRINHFKFNSTKPTVYIYIKPLCTLQYNIAYWYHAHLMLLLAFFWHFFELCKHTSRQCKFMILIIILLLLLLLILLCKQFSTSSYESSRYVYSKDRCGIIPHRFIYSNVSTVQLAVQLASHLARSYISTCGSSYSQLYVSQCNFTSHCTLRCFLL